MPPCFWAPFCSRQNPTGTSAAGLAWPWGVCPNQRQLSLCTGNLTNHCRDMKHLRKTNPSKIREKPHRVSAVPEWRYRCRSPKSHLSDSPRLGSASHQWFCTHAQHTLPAVGRIHASCRRKSPADVFPRSKRISRSKAKGAHTLHEPCPPSPP